MTDTLKKYLFTDRRVRVVTASLDQSWQDSLQHVQYPEGVRDLLGELVAAATLLTANLKLDGSLLLQIQGDGAIALLVVECRSDLSIRATVKLRSGQSWPQGVGLQALLNPGGQGRFVAVLDPRNKLPGQQAYQAVVPLVGNNVSEVLEHYMKSSEQLDTRLWLAANDKRAAGLLIQRLPDHGGTLATDSELPADQMDDSWERAVTLASTLSYQELLAHDTDILIHRLFWEESLLELPPRSIRYFCPCTRERVAGMLRMLGQQETDAIIAEQGKIEVQCDFCGKPYVFDPVDAAALFTAPSPAPSADQAETRH
ncbi:Hsp33 family molecular chaperone HslO [Kerstersia gyiorum]|jgi:molecular chaperone Hsp33|uniref:Hsp33 chaperonin n=1 Tax=Kerstersia gyiorum TaxID=206506 RepID=A0A171KVM8_9BURK|nr:Hsp33 family molecular chaperone HslO [Kerstersia gyiorum]AZV94591.1 Hsp33 chaperonin [Bordetella sp. J329]MCO7638434.1 Hsp33 family molecular chaperone HslO [Pseudomonas sp. S 311-6]KAB0542624.1 Hsp33 family molecular chaperone HslO [Kerstersia gyiorum]KKO72945.1 Hsp33 chaperonin [Kerstersia gyiorum]MCH4273267.1 Hsp33 family molecular chaperone HslO [Kerstersia gyiorum]